MIDTLPTVMLLDDHDVVRAGLRAYLAQHTPFRVVGDFGRSTELLRAMTAAPPDIAIIDFSLGPEDVDGFNLLRAVSIKFPATKVLVLSSHHNASTVSVALQAGARGFIGKRFDMEEIATAVRTVLIGRVYLHPEMALELAGRTEGAPTRDKEPDVLALGKLSPREREVIRCCLEGMSVGDIATKFSRSSNTISTQKQSAFRKLGVRNDSDLFKLRELLG